MNTQQKIILRLENEIRDRQEQIEKVKSIPGLELLDLDAYFFNGSGVDFDSLTHEQVVRVMAALKAGTWKKEPDGEAKVNYSTRINDIPVRCYRGEPPPNCKIVEVLETVPAQPEKIVTVRKLVCQ